MVVVIWYAANFLFLCRVVSGNVWGQCLLAGRELVGVERLVCFLVPTGAAYDPDAHEGTAGILTEMLAILSGTAKAKDFISSTTMKGLLTLPI